MGRAARGGRWGFRDPPGLAAPNRAATGQNLPRGARRSVGAGLVTSDPPRGRRSGNATSWALEEELGVGGRGGGTLGRGPVPRGQQEAGGSELGSSGRKARQVPPVGTRASSGPDVLTRVIRSPKCTCGQVPPWPVQQTASWCRRSGRWLFLLCHVNVCPPSQIQAQRRSPRNSVGPPPGPGICFPNSPHLTNRAEHRPPCQPPSCVVEGAG